MISVVLSVYEGIVFLGVAIGFGYLLYADDFVVIHRRFLGLLAFGALVSAIGQFVTVLTGSSLSEGAHLLLVSFVVIGLYSLLHGHPTRDESWFSTLFS